MGLLLISQSLALCAQRTFTPIRKSILSIKWSVTILENKMSSATYLPRRFFQQM